MKHLGDCVICLVVSALAFLILTWLVGCQSATHPTGPAAGQPSAVTATPVALEKVATGLNWLILLAVVALGVGIGLYFILPVHNLSFAIAAVAGGIEVSALVARVSLWFVPWLAGGLALVAFGIFCYEVYAHRKTIEAAFKAI